VGEAEFSLGTPAGSISQSTGAKYVFAADAPVTVTVASGNTAWLPEACPLTLAHAADVAAVLAQVKVTIGGQ
jgi:hypothetical protein